MKQAKRIVTILAAVVIACMCAACEDGIWGGGAGGGSAYIDNGPAIAQPEGDETTVTVCLNSGINPTDVGYADAALKSALSKLTSTTTLANGVFQYNYTKALHNECISSNVRLRFEDYGWGEPLIQKLTAAFASNQGPDIITGETQMSAYMKQGYLQAFPDELAEFVRENMHPLAYSAMTDADGKIYGVAPCASIPVLIYNKELLRSAGVDEATVNDGVSTWAQWLDVGTTLRSKNYYLGGVYCGSNFGGYLRSTPFVYMAGGGLVDGDGKADFVSEGNAAALQFLRDMSSKNLLGVMSANTEDIFYNYFNGNRFGYLVEGSWRIRQAQDLGMDVGFCALPVMNEGDKVQNVAIGASYMSVPVYSQNKDAAFAAVKAYVSEAAQRTIAESDLRPCTFLPIAQSDEYAQLSPVQSKVYEIIDKQTTVRNLPSFASGQEQFWEAWGAALTKTVYWGYGQDPMSIDALLAEAQDKAGGVK